jgi:NAD(P)-dependent dehydrogenase (short-subunit alcohol dehydrogenase family)
VRGTAYLLFLIPETLRTFALSLSMDRAKKKLWLINVFCHYAFIAGRVGAPSDIGGVLLFLVSPASAHVTSATLVVDGGQLVTFGAFAKL